MTVINDEKTAEIVVSTPSGTLPSNLNPIDLSATLAKTLNRRKTDPKTAATAVPKPTLMALIQHEWREDWSLKVLAALTILALSLLVL